MLKSLRLLTVGGLVALAACSDSSGPDATIHGTYTLRTVNGQTLPATIFQDASGRFDITGGTLTLNSNGTFTDVVMFRIVSGTTTITDQASGTGTFAEAGNTVTFTTTDGETYTMTRSGGTLTQVVSEEGLTFTIVYQK